MLTAEERRAGKLLAKRLGAPREVLFKHERRALPRFRQLHAMVQVLSLLAFRAQKGKY